MTSKKHISVLPADNSRAGYSVKNSAPYIPFSVLMPRFWRKVDVDEKTNCWMWMGAVIGTEKLKYGVLVIRIGARNKVLKASRIALALRLGRWPKKEEIARHKCHTARCVNPLHIFPGTHLDNYWDSARDGRMKIGLYGHCHAKRSISTEMAKQIIDMYYGEDGNGFYYKRFNVHKKWTITTIAQKYNVPKAVIMRAVLEKSSWSSYLSQKELQNARELWRSADGQASDSRLRLKKGLWNTETLAKHFNITRGVVAALIEGRTYRDVPRPVRHPNWDFKGTVQRRQYTTEEQKRIKP